jgi:hypothetical protein
MTAIIDIVGREVLDSRGNPTVEVDVISKTDPWAARWCHRAPRPAPMRPLNCATAAKGRYMGKGVEKAVAAVNGALRRQHRRHGRRGPDRDRRGHDRARRHRQQGKLGANAILGVSLAVAKAAQSSGLPLYRYVGGANARLLPVPMMNIINGGAHADNPIDFQEFMIMPVGADTHRRRRADGCRGLPHAEEGTGGRRLQYQCRRRGRLRAQSQARDGRARLHHEIDREAGYKAGATIFTSRSIAPPPSSSRTASTSWKGEGKESLEPPKPWPHISPNCRATSIRSSRSRTAWPRTTGTAGRR